MGFLFDLFRQPDIDQGVQDVRNTPGALLLDVRSPEEYREGHIPGSQNLPLQYVEMAPSVVDNKERELFVYCHSGARSRQAVDMLKRMGYSNARNIGGIAAYSGKVER